MGQDLSYLVPMFFLACILWGGGGGGGCNPIKTLFQYGLLSFYRLWGFLGMHFKRDQGANFGMIEKMLDENL